jgi:RNA polymerase sigma factor (TIGR02999 family)
LEITEVLRRGINADEPTVQEAFPVIYAELKRLAAGHLRGQWNITLSPTALVHEAFLRVAELNGQMFENRAHFFGIASRLMRNVIVDLIRQTNAKKRGVELTVQLADIGQLSVSHSKDLLLLDDALNRLAREHPRQERVIEMKYFGGLNIAETAAFLEISEATVRRDMRFAEAWLRRDLAAIPD